MNKTVLTFSWLVRRAMSLHKRDPQAYLELMGSGTDKLVRGLKIRWEGPNSWEQPFTILDPRSGHSYVKIHGVERDGKFYTKHIPQFTATTYRKRITDKFMPITLPDGVRSKYNNNGSSTKCYFHNADGSVAHEGTWFGGRRGRSGNPTHALILRDEDGKFVGDDQKLLGSLDLHENGWEQHLSLGWFGSASRTRREWLDSMQAIPAGMCDHHKMLTVAAKAYLTAAKMVQEYPKMRMALFPAAPFVGGSHLSQFQAIRHSGDHTPQTVMARDAETGMPTMYHLPEVLLYWKEKSSDYGWPQFVRLSMVIPPHGNPLLDPTGFTSPCSRTVRLPSQTKHYAYWCKDIKVPAAYERAYHSLVCWSNRDKKNDTHTPLRHGSVVAYPSDLWDKQDERITFWPKHQNKVMVTLESRVLGDGNVDLPMEMGVPVAMKPEDVHAVFEEKMLLDTLPLC